MNGANTAAATMDDMAFGRRTMRKVEWRLIPFITLLFTIAQIDRSNIGYAALTMNADLGLTPYLFGWAAGVFFFGYTLLEVPSNIVLNRVGARLWITRILATWGVISAATAFATGPVSLMVLRFLLGAAEAGFLPGMTLFLMWWIPARERARVQSIFFVAAPIAGLVGAPLAGLVLGMDGIWGIKGWEWVFIIEGLPAVLLAFVSMRVLTDRPAQATWLDARERQWLETTMQRERDAMGGTVHTLSAGLTDWRVLYLGALYIGLTMGLYGINVWLPTIIKGLGGFSNLQVTLLTAIPYAIAGASSIVWAWASDRSGERHFHVGAALLVGAMGFAASALMGSTLLGAAFLIVAAIGIFSALPIFWTIPGGFLKGAAAAGGIALVNSIGGLGGFAGPFLTGWIRDATGSFTNALLMLAGAMAVSGLMVLVIRGRHGRAAIGPSQHVAAQ